MPTPLNPINPKQDPITAMDARLRPQPPTPPGPASAPIPNPMPHPPTIAKPATPGRNAQCSCGSGRKFKHCCLNNPRLPQAA